MVFLERNALCNTLLTPVTVSVLQMAPKLRISGVGHERQVTCSMAKELNVLLSIKNQLKSPSLGSFPHLTFAEMAESSLKAVLAIL